jgi:carboxylesterase
MTKNLIIPRAEPFFIPGNRTGCLLVHGLTGSPFEMHEMGSFLAQQGYTVLGVRLAGHATQPDDLLRVRWQDWLASVEDGLHLLRGSCDRVFIAGLSLGGCLSLLSAARYPMDGAICMSTLFAMPDDWRMNFLRLLSPLLPWVPKGAADWHNPEAAKDHIEYPAFSTHAIAELRDMLKILNSELPNIQVPVLLIQSKNDQGVSPENMDNIYSLLGSRDKRKLWLEDSGHNIPRDNDRFVAFQAAADFISDLSRSI